MKTLVIIFLLLIAGCMTPLQRQSQALNAAYQRGEISASDYYARMNELEAINQANWRNLSTNLMNFKMQPTQLPPLQPLQIRQNRSGYIMGPGGQMYFYSGN